MTLFFSAETGAHYDTSIWRAALPADAVAVTPARHAELLAAVAEGQVIGAGAGGAPIAISPPAATVEDLARLARARRDSEFGIRWLLDRHRDEIALGLTTTLMQEDYLLVLTHVQALRDVPEQENFPTEIDWPVLPAELRATGD